MAIFVILSNRFFSLFPHIVDSFYSEGIFLGIRYLYDFSLGLLPFPIIYLIIFVLLILAFNFARKIKKSSVSGKTKLGFVLKGLVNFVSIVIICFYVFWGYNYLRPTIAESLSLEIKALGLEKVQKESSQLSQSLRFMRAGLSKDSIALDQSYFETEIEVELRKNVKNVLLDMGFKVGGRVRTRLIQPKGVLLRFSTAGIYIPHSFEGHVDKGMHPLQWPFAMAHEMTHAYGFTDEGECNFIAYLATTQSADPLIRYCGSLSYWRYLVSVLRRGDKEGYRSAYELIGPGVEADLAEMRKYQNRYPDLIPQIRNAIYNQYLKSHGIKEGIISYSKVLLLVDAWNRKNQALLEK